MPDITDFLPRFGAVASGSFLLAAVATPLAIGIGGAPLIVPPFAAWWGLPAYLLLGVPAFWLTIKGFPTAVERRPLLTFIRAATVANLGTFPLYLAGYPLLYGSHGNPVDWATFGFAYGLVFAPLHGLVFGALYRAMTAGHGVTTTIRTAFTAS
jgi:hypothetical protein